MAQQDLYEPRRVQQLFNNMSDSYERVNVVSSFGFSARWRHQVVSKLDIIPGETVLDAMTGMGECWRPILRNIGDGHLIAVDFSEGMLAHARARQASRSDRNITVLGQDMMNTTVADATVDAVTCGFGLKTLNDDQLRALATEVKRLLRPGGRFSLIEVSIPRAWLLRLPYQFYISRVIPMIGRVLLGGSEDYRMLGRYTVAFGDAQRTAKIFSDAGLPSEFVSYFFGCATGVLGRKPLV